MTKDDVRNHLSAACKAAGSMTAWARAHGMSLGYVNDVIKGRRLPGPAILRALGLRRYEARYDYER